VLKQTVQRYVAHAYQARPAAAGDIPLPVLQVDKTNKARLLEQYGLTLERPVVCMMPGAEYSPAKRWPIAFYAELAATLAENGWQTWILGSDKDKAAADKIAGSGNEHIYNLCGKTQLVDTVDLLACAGSVVSNDSGLMHVAAAVGADLKVIYGSSTPEYTPPLTEENKRTIFYMNLSCSPCFERTCKFGHYDCLTGIKPEQVLQSIQSGNSVKSVS